MTGKQFAALLKTSPLTAPKLFYVTTRTIQKIPKSLHKSPTSDGTVYKTSNTLCYIGFHLTPEKFTESADENYFRLPVWGRGSFPIFQNVSSCKEYLSLLPTTTKSENIYSLSDGTVIPVEKIRVYLPPAQEKMDGYPVYYNVGLENVVSVIEMENPEKYTVTI